MLADSAHGRTLKPPHAVAYVAAGQRTRLSLRATLTARYSQCAELTVVQVSCIAIKMSYACLLVECIAMRNCWN